MAPRVTAHEHSNTFNNLLEDIAMYNLVIGLRKGEAIYLKNRYEERRTLDNGELLKVIIDALGELTGISLFDKGIEIEIINAIKDIFKKHNIELKEENTN